MTTEDIPKHFLDERLRNRCIDVLELLADGNATVRQFGVSGYFNWFFEYFPDEGSYRPSSSMTGEEASAINDVLVLMQEASDATPQLMNENEFLATGWSERIQPVATHALTVFLTRGRGEENHSS